ncbi:MAG: acetolactate synthase large subunit [Nitrosopumilaceae archaeon]
MKASDLFVKCLESEKVEYIFGLPGEENADMMMSLLESNIKFVLARHEQSAAFMADVYGRLTNKVGVCLATLGPGATNLTTGIANANMDRSRVMAITGQTGTNSLHKESHQNMDVITMFKPITKWNWSLRNADSIPEVVRRAFKVALEEKAGATHIELPQDVAKMNSSIPPIPTTEVLRSLPNMFLIKKAVALILKAKKPLILVGNGCIRENATFYVRKFAELTGICSVNTFMSKGVISDSSERHLKTIGIKEADHVLLAMKESDLIIAIGYDLVEYGPKFWNRNLDKKIIHIDFTPAETDTYYPPAVEIAADIELTIDSILSELEKEKKKDPCLNCFPFHDVPELFKKIHREIVQNINEYENDSSYPIKPEKLIGDVRKNLEKRDIVISDVGVHKLWISKIYDTFEPNTCLIPNGFCSMGFSLPGAIAAQLVYPNKKIVSMCGDGSFMMNIQDLETAVRLKLPIIIIVWVDEEYGLISLKQRMEFGHSGFTKFTNPDFVMLAKSFGAKGFQVKSVKEFQSALSEATQSTEIPVIIAVNVDYTRNEILLNDEYCNLPVQT